MLSPILALLLVRILYTTTVGIMLLDRIPDEVFHRLQRLIGNSDPGLVEDAQNIDVTFVFLVCLVISVALVSGVGRSGRLLFRKRG